jgi:hypothetical protein
MEVSEPLVITHPELIASFDETKVSLDSTEASISKTDRGMRTKINDDGKWIMTNSSSCATAVCGRLKNGEV